MFTDRSSYYRQILVVLILMLTCIVTTAFAAVSTGEESTVYKTDFSDAEGWLTNSNERFNLDEETERYHYVIEGGTGGYSAVPLPVTITGSCTLEFDITPVLSDEGGTHRFGIGSDKKDSLKGPLIMAELANKDDGRLFYLKTISKGNALNTIGSSPSTGSSGLTVRFEDNTTYHIRLTYYAEDNRASMTVLKAGSQSVLFSLIAPMSGSIGDLTHLFITTLGDGTTGPKAEGYIDNIEVTTPSVQPLPSSTPEPEETDTPGIKPTLALSDLADSENTASAGAEPTEEDGPGVDTGSQIRQPGTSRTLLPPPPSRQPTPVPQSGGFPFLVIPAIAGAAGILVRQRKV